jgi:hypothetical protein
MDTITLGVRQRSQQGRLGACRPIDLGAIHEPSRARPGRGGRRNDRQYGVMPHDQVHRGCDPNRAHGAERRPNADVPLRMLESKLRLLNVAVRRGRRRRGYENHFAAPTFINLDRRQRAAIRYAADPHHGSHAIGTGVRFRCVAQPVHSLRIGGRPLFGSVSRANTASETRENSRKA